MILMYHHVCPPDKIPIEQADLEGWQFTISPADFRNQLENLRKQGFQFVSLSHYVDSLGLPFGLRAKQMAITFDDGWRDNHEYALPILQSLGLTATFYIVTGEMKGVDPAKRMSVRELQDLAKADMGIGGHSVSHPNLATLSLERLQSELRDCKHELQDSLGIEVRHFAYPGGRFNRLVLEQCELAGYQSAVCSIGWGRNNNSNRYALFRETLDESSTPIKRRLQISGIFRLFLAARAQTRLRSALSR